MCRAGDECAEHQGSLFLLVIRQIALFESLMVSKSCLRIRDPHACTRKQKGRTKQHSKSKKGYFEIAIAGLGPQHTEIKRQKV